MTTKTAIQPSIQIEHVTPEKAAAWLGTMRGNRPLRNRAVQRYAREMLTGRWLVNGEAIKFDREGRLADGQHRLNAVILAKKTVPMLIVRGIDEGAMITLDTGVGRTFFDATTIAGKDYPRNAAAIARLWYLYESKNAVARRIIPSHQDIQNMIDLHPSIIESGRWITHLRTVSSRCLPSVQGFVHAYVSEKVDRDMANSFMEQLNEGSQLADTDPIFHLRKRLIDENMSGKRMEQDYVLAITIKAWNAWIEGGKFSSTRTLRWRSGIGAEAFPQFSCDGQEKT